MRGIGRRLRSSFGIGSSRMAIRSQLAWYWRWVLNLLMMAAVAGIVWWLVQEPVPGAADSLPKLESETPRGTHRILVIAAPGTASVRVAPSATDIVVVVPALASTVEALTGAVDDRRAEAEATANRLAASLPNARGEIGADNVGLAVEDALRTFGADEIVVAGDDAMAAEVRSRVTIPVSRA